MASGDVWITAGVKLKISNTHLSCVVLDSKVVNSNTGFHIEGVFLEEETRKLPGHLRTMYVWSWI